MIKGCKGGTKTLTGLEFESRISLKDRFNTLLDYSVKDGNLTFKGKKVAYLFKKYEFYSKFLDKRKAKWKEIIAKKQLENLKKSLMKKLLSGEIRVKMD